MGTVYADITLKNAGDNIRVQERLITEKEVRAVPVRALVDTGAGTLVINEEVREKLGLAIQGLRRAELADGNKQIYKVTEPVDIHWKDRETSCRALVIPGASDILLGAIPLEDMDLVVNPALQELVGAHGDDVVCLVKQAGHYGS
jgi:clan AA aspartic protease